LNDGHMEIGQVILLRVDFTITNIFYRKLIDLLHIFLMVLSTFWLFSRFLDGSRKKNKM